jgi:hypothetical protein
MALDSTETAYTWENGERIPAQPDNITTALPNATTAETTVFQFGKVQGRVEAEIFAVEELTIPDGQTLTLELLWDSARDGSFANGRVINSFAPSGAAEVIAAGDAIGIVTPETDVEQFCKIKFTASSDLSSNNVLTELYPTA